MYIKCILFTNFVKETKLFERMEKITRVSESGRKILSLAFLPKKCVSFFSFFFNFHPVCVSVACLFRILSCCRCRWFRFHLIPLYSKQMYIFFSNFFPNCRVNSSSSSFFLSFFYLHICRFTIICIRLSMENKYFSMNGKWSRGESERSGNVTSTERWWWEWFFPCFI